MQSGAVDRGGVSAALTRLVVASVVVLAVVAAGDSLRPSEPGETTRPAAAPGSRGEPARFLQVPTSEFEGEGAFLHDHVVRAGKAYLSADAIEAAFPVAVDGPLDISKLALAPDNTLVLAVYRFPVYGGARGALEFWRNRELVGAFAVPPVDFGGGLAFNRDGSLVATFSRDGRLRGIFDRRGRRVSGLADAFVVVDEVRSEAG